MIKYLSVILLIVLGVACAESNSEIKQVPNQNKPIEKKIVESQNFDWLLGDWKRLHEQEGKQTFETWEKTNSMNYSGVGYTLQNGDTIKKEVMFLVKTESGWDLNVQPQDEPNPITFTMTSFTENEFVCENPELDFPKMIKYWKGDSTLKALVSGTDLEIEFEFEQRIK